MPAVFYVLVSRLLRIAEPRPYADPAKAADRLIEIAKTLRNDKGRLPVGEWNSTFLKGGAGSVAEYTAGRDKLVADGIIMMHECGCMFLWKTAPAAEELLGTQQMPR